MSDTRPHSLAALAARHGDMYRWRVLVTVMIGTVASIMASTIVNVAVPDLMRYFSLGQERAQWVSAGFMAAMALAMLTTPWLLERFGYRHTYIGAISLLMIGGVVGGLAQDYQLVLAMRVAEGLAAGVLQPIPSIIILRAFERSIQGKAMGIFGFGVVMAPAIGPSVGGVLVEHFGWRSIFFFVVPFALVALALGRRYLPVSAPGGAHPGTDSAPFDVVGLLLAAVAVVSMQNGLVHLHDSPRTLACGLLVLALGALLLFVRHAWRAPHPLLNLRIFASRPFAMGSVVAFVYGMGLFGSTYLIPVYMQTALRFSPSEAGAVLLPAGLVLAIVIPIAGRMADRVAPYLLVSAGLALLALSFLLMGFVGRSTALAVLMLWAVVGRIGLGLVLPSLNLGAMREIERDSISQAASGISFLRQLGGAAGVSLVGIFLEWRLRVHGTPNDTTLAAFAETFWLVAGVSLAATFAALRMRSDSARPQEP